MTKQDFPPERDVHAALSTSEPHHELDPEVDPRMANPHELSRPERRRAGH